MGVLAELGLEGVEGTVLLIDPPPGVSAEAGVLKPRPGVASSIAVARPAAHIAWWPTLDQLSAATLSRLGWLADAGGGSAWVVLDPGDGDSPRAATVLPLVSEAGRSVGEQRPLGSGELAIRVV